MRVYGSQMIRDVIDMAVTYTLIQGLGVLIKVLAERPAVIQELE